ncbi:hypothetical protein [Isoptericola sp. BMS4]|uniref:restriction system modified-DNA reader domain-containing protein n=1 Tax=Isoptericola sp. BMS4 TaxID=2527875 RepID=UPI00141F2ECD|nr:hypothetical protein [Isoptericola sp. BMS4]
MPLFEVDGQRPLLVQSARQQVAREPGVGTTAHTVVETHIDGLLGEQIFPVAPGNGPDEPHLLALDATGSPVVVELVADLDRSALTRALDHAGAAGRLTRGQLAARYHGGEQAFHRDVAAFYDSVPLTRSQPGRSSARLIMICQEASEEILNAVDFLRQPTMPVEVLKMGVVHSADGRRFVDVSPLVIHPASSPAAPQLSADTRGGAATGDAAGGEAEVVSPAEPAAEREPESFAEGVAVGLALHDKAPAEARSRSEDAPTRSGRRRAAASRDLAVPEPAPAADDTPPRGVPAAPPTPDLPTSLPGGVPAPRRRTAPARRRSRTDRFSGGVHDTSPLPPLPADPPAAPAPAPPPGASTHRPGLDQEFAAAAAPAFDLPLPAPRRERPAVPPPRWSGAADDLPRLQVPPLEPPRLSVPPLEAPRLSTAAPAWASSEEDSEDEVDPDLAALAGRLGVPTRLRWSRPRRRQHFEAVLQPDGAIELPGGGRYRHPDLAASVVSGSPTVDGWTVWQLADGSGSLLDAYRARFA